MIQRGQYRVGDRLPSIMEMAKRFGVGHPTVREALKKLETIGVVEIRHGSGVYVSRSEEVLVLASPDYPGTVSKKLLLDLIRARMALEAQSVADAVQKATAAHLKEMRRLLTTDRKSTRLNSSHGYISYAVFCLKKKNKLIVKPPRLLDNQKL